MTDTYYQDRLYMPRRIKRAIRVLMALMVLGFAAGIALLYQDGVMQQGTADWQKAGQTVQEKF